MGSGDRIFRTVVAIIIAVLYFSNIVSGTVGLVLLILSVVFLLTSLIGFCPLYKPFGINTCPNNQKQ